MPADGMMWLLQVNVWFGPSINAQEPRVEPQVKIRGYASRLPLGNALLELKNYANAINNIYSQTAISYSVFSACQIPNLTDAQMAAGDITFIDDWRDSI